MKNIKKGMLKKCIFMPFSEYTSVIERSASYPVTINVEWDGLVYFPAEENFDVLSLLSDYFGVKVTSVHIDDGELIGVWIAYKEKD